MSDGLGQGAALSPARDPTEHEGGVSAQQIGRAIAQTFHDAGTKTLDHGVGGPGQAQNPAPVRRRFQIDRHGGPIAVKDGAAHLGKDGRSRRFRAGEAQHLGPHVGQHHAREGDGPQSVEFEDAKSVQRFHMH